MSEWSYIVAAYAVTGAALLAYGARLWLLTRRAAASLESQGGGDR